MSEKPTSAFDYRTYIDKSMLIRGIIGAFGLLALFIIDMDPTLKIVVALLSYVLVGSDVLYTAVKRLLKGDVFNEFFLMSIATIGAFLLGDMAEGVAVMLFYLIGEFFQELATRRSRHSIESLLDMRPDRVRVIENEQTLWKKPEEVRVGDVVAVLPGERVPLDGVVKSGAADVDTQAITGEPVPRSLLPGDEALSGFVSLTGRIELHVSRAYHQSTSARILQLVREAETKKAVTERFISRFAGTYTMIVVFLAIAIGILVPLIGGLSYAVWLRRALVFLVISCPCAMVVSIPLTFFAGIGAGAKRGILVKGGNVLEALADVDTIFFDKTGTLTSGKLRVKDVIAEEGFTVDDVFQVASRAEQHSAHPVAAAILSHNKTNGELINEISDFREVPGYGVEASIDGRKVLVGNKRQMERGAVKGFSETEEAAVHVAIDGIYAGRITLEDELKKDAMEAISGLRERGVKHLALLSGDRAKIADSVKLALALDEASGELLPEDKAAEILHVKNERQDIGKIMYVGDGINDAPALATADVGVAMGAIGKDAAIETADMVLMTDDLTRLPTSLWLGKKTRRVAAENLIIALGGKIVFMVLGALGLVGIWGAVFADTGLALITILNAIKLFFFRYD